jgi:hypothetical protein
VSGLILSVSGGARSIDRTALRDWGEGRAERPLVYAVGHYVRRRARGLPGCGWLAQPYQRLVDGDHELSVFFAAVADWRPIAVQARGFYATRAAIPRWREIGRRLIHAIVAAEAAAPTDCSARTDSPRA